MPSPRPHEPSHVLAPWVMGVLASGECVWPASRKKARQGVRALRPTRPAGLTLHLAEPSSDGPTQDNGLDFAPRHAPQVSPCGFWQGKVLAGRNPLLLLRFAGLLLLR